MIFKIFENYWRLEGNEFFYFVFTSLNNKAPERFFLAVQMCLWFVVQAPQTLEPANKSTNEHSEPTNRLQMFCFMCGR